MIDNLKVIFKNSNTKIKNKFFFCITFVFISSFIELIGLSAFLPLINFLTVEDIGSDPFFLKISQYLNFVDINNYVFFCLSLISMTIFIKSIFIISVQYFINHFIKDIKIFFQNFLLKKYIYAEISFHSKKNSNYLLNTVLTSAEIGSTAGVASIINLFKEFFVIFLILSFLLFINFQVTIITTIFLVILVGIYYFFVKIKLANYGEEELYYNSYILKNLNETFRSIKEIKTYFLEKIFLNKTLHNFTELEKNRANRTTLTSSPRNILELVLILTLCMLIYYVNIYTGTNREDLLGLLAIFALSAMRLLPSINSILRFVQNLKFSSEALKRVSEEFLYFENEKHDQKKVISTDKLRNIEIINLNFLYKSKINDQLSENEVFKNAKINITKGITGIIGESGSGKSTLIEILMGFLKPSSGNIKINNQSMTHSPGFRLSKVAYVPQKSFILDNSLVENITFQREENVNMNLYKEIIDLVGLKHILHENKLSYDVKTGEDGKMFSGGQIQRISIARALYSQPNLIILDESTNALDSESEKKLIKNIIKYMNNKYIIIISHRKELYNFCDRIFKIDNKKILEFK